MALGKKTGGRRKGTKNKKTLIDKDTAAYHRPEIEEKLASVLPQIFEGDAHGYLMSVYKDASIPLNFRLEAAGKAIRYERPALQSREVRGEITLNLVGELLSEIDGRSRGLPALESASFQSGVETGQSLHDPGRKRGGGQVH